MSRIIWGCLCLLSPLYPDSLTIDTDADWTILGELTVPDPTGDVIVQSGATLTVLDGGGIGDPPGVLTLTAGKLAILNTGTPFTTEREVEIMGSGTIQVDTGTATFEGAFSGGGNLTKVGAGTLTLGADSSLGDVQITTGAFHLTTMLSTTGMSVASGAVLSGTGTATGTGTVTNEGTLFPGTQGTFGTFTVEDMHYVQAAGSTLEIEVGPGDTPSHDVLAITGMGMMHIEEGAVVSLVLDPGEYPPLAQIPIVIASAQDKGTGQFATVITNLPAFTGQLVYLNSAPHLSLFEQIGAPLEDPWQTVFLFLNVIPFHILIPAGNAAAVAFCLDNTSHPDGSDLGEVVGLLQFMTIPEMIDTMNQMDSSLYNALDLSQEETAVEFRQAISRRAADWQRAVCSDPRREEAWGGFIYSQSHQHGKGFERGFETRGRTGVVGFDYRFSDRAFVGGMFGYARDNLHWTKQTGSSAVNTYAGGFYAGSRGRWAYTTAALLGFYDDYEGKRRIVFEGNTPTVRTASHDGEGWGGVVSAEVGGIFSKGTVEVHPFGLADYVVANRFSFTETGAGSIDLKVQGHTADLLRTELGMQFLKCTQQRSDSRWFPHAKIAWAYEQRFMGEKSKASFVDSSCVMQVKGLIPRRSLLVYGGGLDVRGWDDHFFLGTEVDVEWSKHYWNYTFEAQVKVGF